MKALIRTLGVGALVLASACVVPTYRARVEYRSGYGGSGVDLVTAESVCRRTAYSEGWRWLRQERADVTGPYSARFRFGADGIPFRTHVTCFYDARSNLASIR